MKGSQVGEGVNEERKEGGRAKQGRKDGKGDGVERD